MSQNRYLSMLLAISLLWLTSCVEHSSTTNRQLQSLKAAARNRPPQQRPGAKESIAYVAKVKQNIARKQQQESISRQRHEAHKAAWGAQRTKLQAMKEQLNNQSQQMALELQSFQKSKMSQK